MMRTVLAKKTLNKETQKLIGKDAGSSRLASRKDFLDKINALRDKAEVEFLHAIYANIFRKRRKAREHIEKALLVMAEAFWNAEGTDQEEAQHQRLHAMAKWKHDYLGCFIERSGENFVNKCAIVITHKRLGFSIGFTGDAICTICNKDEFDCEHLGGRTYWVLGGLNEYDRCRACGEVKCNQHDTEHIYKVVPFKRFENPVLHEVSMVRRPAMPTARQMEVSISREEIEARLGAIDESAGMAYRCHACKGECPGFIEFFDD